MTETLLDRLERATGPDRELDAEIWLATVDGATCKHFSYVHSATGSTCHIDETREHGRLIIVPAYTESLDAALTLVPEGCELDLQTRKRYCTVHRWDAGRCYGVPLGSTINAATPALALCIAALKARTRTQE